jgi:hypothetical protein
MTEYLRLGPHGGRGYTTGRREAFPKCNLRHRFRTHRDSEFSAAFEWGPGIVWNETIVDYDGAHRSMIWTRNWNRHRAPNRFATGLLRHKYISGQRLSSHWYDGVVGDSFLPLSQQWKPFVDVNSSIHFGYELEEVVRPLFSGWWHAVPIANGWRIFSENITELMYVKLSI